MRHTHLPVTATAILLLLFTSSASAQDWRRDAALAGLTDEQGIALAAGVAAAPERALQALFAQDVERVSRVSTAEQGAFARESWGVVLAEGIDGRLGRAIAAQLAASGVASSELHATVWTEEQGRMRSVRRDVMFATVDRAMRAALIDRLTAVHEASAASLAPTAADGEPAAEGDGRREAWRLDGPDREDGLEVWRREELGGTARPVDAPLGPYPNLHDVWYERRGEDHVHVQPPAARPLPPIAFFTREATLEHALYERTFKSELGDLRVTAARVEGLANARAGRLVYHDAFGRNVEGIGATFKARARVTGAGADLKSEDIQAALARDLGISAHLRAFATLMTDAELNHTTLMTPLGMGSHTEVRAGSGAEVRASVPIVIDLKVLTLRVTPYASAHAGVAAGAIATFEVEWSGSLRLDLGGYLSSGFGFGAGVKLEIDLGPMLRRALERLIAGLSRVATQVADSLRGNTWRGPLADSGRLTLSLEDLERRWTETGAPPTRPELDLARDGALAVAARYAPAIYQHVQQGEWDLLRRVDFDGDWDVLNNWENTGQGDRSASVYYDVRETETHYFVTYAFYHSGRKSGTLRALRRFVEHANTMGGCIVVARKDAPPGREVEALLTSDGKDVYVYTGLEREGAERTRWPAAYGRWSGPVQFVDEVDHPHFDLERTRPQVWITARDHRVFGFTGRSDGEDAFEGRDGVAYYYTGRAEEPSSFRDPRVGYDLRPLSELMEHMDDARVFTQGERVRGLGGVEELPARLRGDVGRSDQAAPPWAWGVASAAFDRTRARKAPRPDSDWVQPGDLFADPARVLGLLFHTPDDFSATYRHNPFIAPARLLPAPEGDSAGLAARLAGAPAR